jgi:hypothetical protein
MMDQYRFCTGNAVEEGRGGWFIGQFISIEEGLKHQNALELKWGRHPKGECRPAFAEYKISTTVCILISGILSTKAIVGEETCEVTLRQPGDYIIFGPKVPHSWEAVEDCIVLSVRFPSVAADQIELPD